MFVGCRYALNTPKDPGNVFNCEFCSHNLFANPPPLQFGPHAHVNNSNSNTNVSSGNKHQNQQQSQQQSQQQQQQSQHHHQQSQQQQQQQQQHGEGVDEEGRRVIECEVCCKKLSDNESLSKHMKLHDIPTSHFCDVCSKGYKFKKSLIHHLGKVHRKYFYCLKCMRSFEDKFVYDEHNRVVETPAPVPFWNPGPNKLQCMICHKIFDSQCSLNVHFTDAHLNGLKSFQTQPPQPTHGQGYGGGHHNRQNQTQNQNNQNANQGGGESSRAGSSRQGGGGGGGGGKSGSSSSGSNSTSNNKGGGGGDVGIKVGGFVKEFKCELCSKTFDREAFIVAHRKLVHFHSPWECNVCAKSFKCRSRLKRHEMTVHEEARPFECNVCQKTFRHPDILKVHHQTHLEIKRHQCKICPSSNSSVVPSFASTRGLKRHMAKHHSGA